MRIGLQSARLRETNPALTLRMTHIPSRFFSLALLICLLATVAAMPVSGADSRRPNLILIMSDDMGWSDLGCYGGEIETPNLDALARDGVRFTHFYNTGRCCPTRASLLTGLYPHQAGIGHMMEDKGLNGYRGDLNRNCVTIAEALRLADYRTYMAGKWHVTKTIRPSGESDKHNWPLQRGFDRFYGTIHGAGSFYDPNTLVRDNTLISPYADPEYQPKQFYYTDAINDHAVRFVAEHARDHASKPFFMYVAHTAAHWPMHAKEADIAKYKGKYDAGYDAIRVVRVEKLKQLGLIDPQWQVAPQQGGAWSEVPDREFELRCMEVYAAMVDCLDQGIGRLVAELKQHRPVRQHADPLPAGQRRLRRRHGPRQEQSRTPATRRPALAAAAGRRLSSAGHDSETNPRRLPDAAGLRRAARRGGHLPRLRRGVGQRQQHALPRIQALGPRGGHQHAAGRALAGWHPRRTSQCPGAAARAPD